MTNQNSKPCLRFDIVSAFPEAFSYLDSSLIKRAKEKKLISVKIWNLRDFTKDKHKIIDDKPYGGGPGMALKVEPIYKAVQQISAQGGSASGGKNKNLKVILTDAGGKQFTQDLAKKLSKEKQIIIICGHYEGVDERVKKFVDMKISVGPYILTGGELPSMIIVDAVSRHIEGVLGNPESLEERRSQHSAHRRFARPSEAGELILGLARPSLRSGHHARSPSGMRFAEVANSLPNIPVYTRPEVFIDKKGKKYKVPKVLLSGDHKKIEEWRQRYSKKVF